MELDEIARSLEEIRLDMLRDVTGFERRDIGPHRLKDGVHHACVRIYAVGRMLDDLADATDPDATIEGEGFVVLPVGRFDELRQAEEHLQETRFAPADGDEDGDEDDKQATIDALTRENGRLKAVMSSWEVFARIKGEEIARLKGDAKVRAEAAAPLKPAGLGTTAGEPQFHPVLDKHLQDIQGEIDGIKERLDEGCGEFRKLSSRIDVCSDRMGTLSGRMNRLEARDGLNPILRDEARKQEEAIKSRLLQEVNSARKTDPS